MSTAAPSKRSVVVSPPSTETSENCERLVLKVSPSASPNARVVAAGSSRSVEYQGSALSMPSSTATSVPELTTVGSSVPGA